MWSENYDSDKGVSDGIKKRWETGKHDVQKLDQFSVQRCIKPKDFGEVTSVELHHFSDASSVCYGVCSYIRLKNEHNQVHVSFLMEKSRVIPLKHMTISRLELTAALVAVKVSKFLNKELKLEGVKNVYWSDNQVALGYIANDTRRFHILLANCVDQIRDYTNVDEWFNIRSEDNPTDCASRGLVDSVIVNRTRIGYPAPFYFGTLVFNLLVRMSQLPR